MPQAEYEVEILLRRYAERVSTTPHTAGDGHSGRAGMPATDTATAEAKETETPTPAPRPPALRTYGTLWDVIGAPMPAAPPVFVLAQQAHTDMCSPCAGDNLPP